MPTLIKLHDDTGKKYLFKPNSIKDVTESTESRMVFFLSRKGRFVVNVKHVSPGGLFMITKLYFNKFNRSMATATRLRSHIV